MTRRESQVEQAPLGARHHVDFRQPREAIDKQFTLCCTNWNTPPRTGDVAWVRAQYPSGLWALTMQSTRNVRGSPSCTGLLHGFGPRSLLRWPS